MLFTLSLYRPWFFQSSITTLSMGCLRNSAPFLIHSSPSFCDLSARAASEAAASLRALPWRRRRLRPCSEAASSRESALSLSLSLSSAARALPAETLLTFRSPFSSVRLASQSFCEPILPRRDAIRDRRELSNKRQWGMGRTFLQESNSSACWDCNPCRTYSCLDCGQKNDMPAVQE